MAVPITALQITSSAVNSDAEFRRVEGGKAADGKIADGYYLYYKKGDGEPITGLAVTHDDKPPGDGYVKLETSLTKTAGRAVYVWYQTKGSGSPIIEMKLITSDDASVGPGFNRISEELNPEAAGEKQYLTYKTKAAQQKLDARDFKVGDLVDCVDTSNAWLVGRIMAVDAKEDRVQLHYEGWDPKWDEWLSRRSPRIAVHGSHTGGKWTGNRSSREPWNMAADKDNFAAVTKRVEAIVALVEAKYKEVAPKLNDAKNDEKATAALKAGLALGSVVPRDEYTFLLQDNYRYVMNVLNAQLDDKAQWVHTQHFLQLQMRLIIHALKFDPELHVGLQNIFLLFMCADLEFQKYYADYGRTADDPVDLTLPYTHRIQFTQDPRSLVSALLCGSINNFGVLGGFEAAQYRLHHPAQYRDSFFATAKIIQALAGVRNVLNPKWREPYILGLKLPELVQDRLAKVTDDDLKTLDKTQLSLLSANVQGLLSLVLDTPKLMAFIEQTNLTMCLRQLQSGVLAKRLDGMTQLELALASIKPRDERAAPAAHQHYGQQPQVQPAQYLTPKLMVEWLTAHRVLDLLLARDSHEQVIKRTPPVLKFLAQQNALKPVHLSMLWSSGAGKTDGVVRIVYDSLADLSQELSEEHLDELFRKIQEKKLSEYRDFDLKFIRDFTVAAVHATKPEKTNKWYGLDLFWHLLHGGNAAAAAAAAAAGSAGGAAAAATTAVAAAADPIPANIQALASTYLTNLLAQPQFNPQLAVYLDKCIKALHTGSASAILQALRLAQQIIDAGAPDQATKGKHSKEEVIAKLEKDHKLLAALMADVGRYRAEAQKALTDTKPDAKAADAKAGAAAAAAADPSVGGYLHSAHVQTRLDFLDFVLVNTAGELKFDQKFVDTLWEAYVAHPLVVADRSRCLAWMARAIVKVDRKGKSILAGLSGHIFRELLCNEAKLPYAGMPLDGWTCFETFCTQLNHTEDALMANPRGGFVVINHAKLLGLDALWTVATKATSPDVLAAASAFLTQLHIRLDWVLTPKEKRAIFKAFVDRAMAAIKDGFQQIKKAKEAKADAGALAPVTHRVTQLLAVVDEYLVRMHNNELIGRPRFAEGMKVHAFWKSQHNQKYHAEVKKVNRDGSYQVLYADGDRDDFAPERNLFFPDGQGPKNADAKVAPEDDYAALSATPRTLLSNDQHYFDLLFDLLGVGGDVARLVIKLLTRLPVNQGLSDTIKNLTTATSVDWNQLLPRDSVMKLSYTLRIVRSQVIPPPLPPTPEGAAPDPSAAARQAAILAVYNTWADMFLAKGGFVHLAGIFFGTKPEDMLASPLTQDCLFMLLELLRYFLAHPTLGKAANPLFDHEKALRQLLPSLEAIVLLPPAEAKADAKQLKPAAKGQPAVNPEVEAENQTRSQLVQYCLHSIVQCAAHKPALLEAVVVAPAQSALWDRVLSAGLLHKTPAVRKAASAGLSQLCAFPAAHTVMLPKLLAIIGQLNTTQHAAICSEYFECCGAELKRGAAPAAGAAAAAPAAASAGTPVAAAAVVPAAAAAAVDAKADGPKAPLYDAAKLVGDLVTKIRNQPVLEPTPGFIDYMLCGLFNLTEQLVQQNPALKEPLGKQGLIDDVLLCLFDAPKGARTPGVLPPPKCKNAKTRKDAYLLLQALAEGTPPNRRKVMDAVTPYHQTSHSGLLRSDEWNFEARNEEKSNTGYLGLVNLACICYQNSNLQQLFMQPKFRASILAIDTYKETDLAESMVYQLQRLFGQLQESEKLAVNPRDFVHTYKGDDGKPVDVRVQEDSGEFLRKVLDRLSTSLKGTKYANAVKDVFGGVLVNQKIGRGPCTHYKERDEEFFGVQIQVKDKKTLDEGLAQFVAGDVMEENNSVRCDACGKKVPCLMRQVFKRLPPTMIFVLKRFEMDYNTMDITKLNSKLAFPFKVNLRPYCQETLTLPKGHTPADAATATAATAKPADGKAPGTPPSKTPETSASKTPEATAVATVERTGPLHPDEYYEYVLRGMVVHTGSAHGGHYYSFIQERLDGDQEGKWYEFNDTRVSPFNPDHIPEETFGGSDDAAPGRRGGAAASGLAGDGAGGPLAGSGGGYERSRNAYILYYDRVKPKMKDVASTAVVATGSDASSAPTTPTAASPSLKTMKQAAGVLRVVAKQRKAARALRARAQLQPTMFKEIWRANQIYWRDRSVFDKVYFEFLWQVFDKIPTRPPVAANEQVVLALPPTENAPDYVQAAKVGTRFLMMTLAHGKEGKDFFNSFMVRLRRLYETDVGMCLWLLQEMFAPDTMWAVDFLMGCPDEAVRNNVADLLCKILTLVSPHEQDALKPGAFATVQETVTTKTATGEDVTTTRDVKVGAGHVVRFVNALVDRLWPLAPLMWTTFDPYFRVLSHFAGLGTAEVQYLLREKNLLARALDLFVGEKSSHPEVNQFATDRKGRAVRVADVLGRPPDLGHFVILIKQLVVASAPPALAAAAAAPVAAPAAAADGKSAPAPAPAPAPAAAGDAKAAPATATAITSSTVVPPTAVGNPLMPLSAAAADLLLGSAKGEFLPKLLATSWTSRRGKLTSTVIAHLCWENEGVTRLVSRVIAQAFVDNDYDGVRPYFRTLMRLVQLKDALHVTRANLLVEQLVTVIHNQSKYWKITDFCLEHLIRMARRCPTVAAWLVAHQRYCDNMVGWLKAYPEAPPPSFHAHRGVAPPAADDHTPTLLKPVSDQAQAAAARLTQARALDPLAALDPLMMRGGRGRGALYGQPDPAEIEARQRYNTAPTGLPTAKKMELLQVLAAGKEIDGPNAPAGLVDAGNASDSDFDLSERKFAVGAFVDVVDSVQKWLVAQIVRVDGPRIEVHFCGWPDKWNETLDIADARVRPLGFKTTREQHTAAGVPQAQPAAAAAAAAPAAATATAPAK